MKSVNKDAQRLLTCGPRSNAVARPCLISPVGQGCGARGSFWGAGSLYWPTAMSREPQVPVDSFKKQNGTLMLISVLYSV